MRIKGGVLLAWVSRYGVLALSTLYSALAIAGTIQVQAWDWRYEIRYLKTGSRFQSLYSYWIRVLPVLVLIPVQARVLRNWGGPSICKLQHLHGPSSRPRRAGILIAQPNTTSSTMIATCQSRFATDSATATVPPWGRQQWNPAPPPCPCWRWARWRSSY
jgi:hypothetical protein